MNLLIKNGLQRFIKSYLTSSLISSLMVASFLSLPASASDCCQSDHTELLKKPLTEHNQFSIVSSKSKTINSQQGKIDPYSMNKIDDKFGVIDASGRIVIPVMYDSITPYDEAFIVEKNALFGLINRQDRPLSAIEYHFDGYDLNQAEEKPLAPLIGYKKLDINDTTTGAWGSIDSSGATIIPFIYDEISTISSYVYEEMTGVYRAKKDDYWGVVDHKGNLVLSANYQKINWFNAPTKLFLVVKDNQAFVINSNENTLIEGNIENISFIDMQEERELSTYDYDTHDDTLRPAIIKINGKYGLFDSNAQQKLSAEYEELSYLYQNDLLAAEKNGLHGVVDTQGKTVIPLVYDELDPVFLETPANQPRELGYFIAKQGSNYGLLSLDNKIILPFEYQSMDYNVFDLPNQIIVSRNYINETIDVSQLRTDE